MFVLKRRVCTGKDSDRGRIKKELEERTKHGYPTIQELDIYLHESSWMTSELKVKRQQHM